MISIESPPKEDLQMKDKCKRCGWEWLRRTTFDPKVCPACHSPYWKTEKVRNIKGGKRFRFKNKEEAEGYGKSNTYSPAILRELLEYEKLGDKYPFGEET